MRHWLMPYMLVVVFPIKVYMVFKLLSRTKRQNHKINSCLVIRYILYMIADHPIPLHKRALKLGTFHIILSPPGGYQVQHLVNDLK